jgi:Domain of unknown function (DUF1998)
MLTLGLSSVFPNDQPGRFEITERRLSRALLDGARIVRVPSNAELGIPDDRTIYKTARFPSWSLCVSHNLLYQKRQNDDRSCPACSKHRNEYQAWAQSNRQAIRFVAACENGHLDDVDWNAIVTHKTAHGPPDTFIWQGAGGALRSINIICPICKGIGNLGVAYSRQWRCTGRFPESREDHLPCGAGASIIQRGAANLFMPELKSALTIPPADTRLHRVFETQQLQTLMLSGLIDTKEKLLEVLGRLCDGGVIGVRTLQLVRDCTDEEVLAAMNDVVRGKEPKSAKELKDDEFVQLRRAAAEGAPYTKASTPNSPPQFEVVRSEIRIFDQGRGIRFRVTPVNRLRVVMVQIGYRRLKPSASLVLRDQVFEDTSWFPGVELFGEGIFVDLVDESGAPIPRRRLQGRAASDWISLWKSPPTNPLLSTDDGATQYNPEFVWWHTLAHRLVNAIAVDSGYSAMAIRERVYCRLDDSGGGEGAVLLYTAQPGGDGTLGGLVSLVPHFSTLLDRAIGLGIDCSNDPLCEENTISPGRVNGACCYACSLLAETSCEHRNICLDRNLLRESGAWL